MGNPSNYSLELPERCLALLDRLWPHAEAILQPNRPDLGPLTSTFLVSMSMPIINLPIERIERRSEGWGQHYASDRPLNPRAAAAIDETLQRGALKEAPFFQDGAWSFACCQTAPLPNIAFGIPDEIAEELDSEVARITAARMPAAQWCSILRNALAHGGVAYLNELGRSTHDEPVKMYAFVSGKYDRKKDRAQLVAVNFLRISENDYREFLQRWVEWLQDSGIARASEAA